MLQRNKQSIYFISLRKRMRTQLSPPPFQLVDLAPSCKARGFFLSRAALTGLGATLVFAPKGQLLWLPWLLPVLPRLSRPSRC
ncbi:hypothetical protein ACSFCA_36510, partial [Variovorax sp. ZT5R36]|uniref:hypothetical protein n=1 Tax=Variovorax sp. ZT5R36 TaxID=3443734 RepID=UPI003F4576E4